MTLDEVALLVRRSRRTVMRMVADKQLPRPIEHYPLSWDERAVRTAAKAIKGNGRRVLKKRRPR